MLHCILGTRLSREAKRGIENVEKPRPSPARKSRTDIKASPIVSRQRESEEIQEKNLTVPSRRTRRILSYEEGEVTENTTQVTTSSAALSPRNIPLESIVNKTISGIDFKFHKLEGALLDKFNTMSADLANLRDKVIISTANQYIRVIIEENEKLKLENPSLTDRLNTF